MSFKYAEMFLLNLKIGDGFNNVIVTRKTKKRIYLSDGNIVHIKDGNGFKYLDGKRIKQILRDIDGYLIYKIHCW